MPLPPGYRTAGSIVQNNGGNVASGVSASVSGAASVGFGTGRDSLVLLAALVVGLIALSYYTR